LSARDRPPSPQHPIPHHTGVPTARRRARTCAEGRGGSAGKRPRLDSYASTAPRKALLNVHAGARLLRALRGGTRMRRICAAVLAPRGVSRVAAVRPRLPRLGQGALRAQCARAPPQCCPTKCEFGAHFTPILRSANHP
jgi:hypothetical protein